MCLHSMSYTKVYIYIYIYIYILVYDKLCTHIRTCITIMTNTNDYYIRYTQCSTMTRMMNTALEYLQAIAALSSVNSEA